MNKSIKNYVTEYTTIQKFWDSTFFLSFFLLYFFKKIILLFSKDVLNE